MAVTFQKVGASTAPVKVAPTEVVPDDAPSTPAASTAVVAQPKAFVSSFSTGTEDDNTPDEGGGRVKYPYLNLVQSMSKAEMKAVAPVGQFCLGGSVKIPSGSRAVIIGFGPTFYREKVKWGGKDKSRTAYSLEEVAKFDGTKEWRESVENRKSGSTKAWFQPAIKAALLVEKPEGADDAHFPHVIQGKAYAVAFFEAKSIAYDSFYVDLNSKRKTTALFKNGWAGRFVAINSVAGKGEDASYHPSATVLEPTPTEFTDLAKRLAASF